MDGTLMAVWGRGVAGWEAAQGQAEFGEPLLEWQVWSLGWDSCLTREPQIPKEEADLLLSFQTIGMPLKRGLRVRLAWRRKVPRSPALGTQTPSAAFSLRICK